MKAHSTQTFAFSLSTALTLAVSLSTLSVAYASDYDSICGGTTPPTGQKASYCSAAKQSLDVVKKEKTLTAVYGAVAGTCAASCILERTLNPTTAAQYAVLRQACSYGALGAAGTDVVMTQNFSAAFMSALPVGVGILEGSTMMSVPYLKQEIQTSCVTAATTAYSAFSHNKSKSSAQSTADSNLASAKSVDDSNKSGAPGYNGTLTGSTPGGNTSVATTASTATIVKPSTDSSDTASNGACGGDTGTTSGAANCAATADPNIAGVVSNPDFQKAFEKSSGMKLDDYLKNAGNLSPSNAIQAAAGSALSGDASVPLGKAIAAAEQAMPDFNQPISNAYASGGGGSKGGSGDAEFNSMMSGLMGKLMPKTEEEKKSGVSEVKFGGAVRNLASVTAEDTTVSLFERVAFRYSHVTPRLLNDPAQRTLSDWSTQDSAASKGASPSAIAPQIKRN